MLFDRSDGLFLLRIEDKLEVWNTSILIEGLRLNTNKKEGMESFMVFYEGSKLIFSVLKKFYFEHYLFACLELRVYGY